MRRGGGREGREKKREGETLSHLFHLRLGRILLLLLLVLLLSSTFLQLTQKLCEHLLPLSHLLNCLEAFILAVL